MNKSINFSQKCVIVFQNVSDCNSQKHNIYNLTVATCSAIAYININSFFSMTAYLFRSATVMSEQQIHENPAGQVC